MEKPATDTSKENSIRPLAEQCDEPDKGRALATHPASKWERERSTRFLTGPNHQADRLHLLGHRRDAAGRFPLDHPYAERPRRLYFALTNHCNRACPWCSTHSSPAGETFLTLERFASLLPTEGRFQVQLEGGEPTIHPQLFAMASQAWSRPGCDRLVLCTNGVALPRQPSRLRAWLQRLGAPLTVKLSVNHYLLDHDRGLIELAQLLAQLLGERGDGSGADRQLVLNVRLRRGSPDNDAWVARAVEEAGLGIYANCFYLQRYGLAQHQPEAQDWALPAAVWHDFELYNPDGSAHGVDLMGRSEAMGQLP